MASTGSTPFPKWQLAILLGAPLAISLGYLYFRNRLEDPEKKKVSELKAKTTISLDNEENNAKVSESAIDRAMKLKGAGNRAFHAGEYDKAIALYNEAIEACPPDRPVDLATFYQNRSACYEKRDMWEQVKEDCTFALKLNEKYVKAFLRRSRAAEKSGDLVLALEDVTSACILERFQVQSSLVNADRILKALGRQHAREALAKRRPVMPSKHFIKTYFSAFSEDPITKLQLDDKVTSGFAKAKQALDAQDYDSIVEACSQELKDADGKYKNEALLLRSTFYLLLGRHDEAQADLAKVIDSDASTKVKVNALIKRASLFTQLENTERCLEDFERAAQLDLNNSDIYHHRGQVYLLLERMDEATAEFAKAVELNPDFSIAYIQKCYADYRHAQINKNVGALTQVRADFERALERFPRCAEAYILFAQVLSDQQEWGRAEALFDAALSVDPNNATLYVHKGLVQLQKSTDFDKAVKLINKAIEMDDKCDFAYETLGTIEVQRGNLRRSLELFEKAISLAKTELEMTHLFSLKDAAAAQLKTNEALLCYNCSSTQSDWNRCGGDFVPSTLSFNSTRMFLINCTGENAMCFVRSWSARARHAWIVQRGCYQSTADDFIPRTLSLPTRAMSCKQERHPEAEYKVCLCQADWCNSASSLVPSNKQYFFKLITFIVGSILFSDRLNMFP